MNKLQITKTTVNIIVGAGTAKIVSSIISSHVIPITNIDKVTVLAASLALGSLVTDVTCHYTDAKIDQIAASVAKLLHK
jgi:hypothetical protein